jgi:NTP pyrophosphatase (non-canonical NTP hydrolase)
VTLDDLIQRLRDFADDRDWEPFHTPKNLVMALSGEVGELTALFQWLTPIESAAAMGDPELKPDVLDEIADVTLYLVRLAGHARHRPPRCRERQDRPQRGAVSRAGTVTAEADLTTT